MTEQRSPARRVAAIADLHGFLPEIPSCDLLLVGGDVCPADNHEVGYQRRWLGGPFREWLEGVDAGEIVGIAGNHDFAAEADPGLMRSLPWTYLCDEATTVAGFLVHGSPWTPEFGGWAFMRSDAELAERWHEIPDDVELLLTHGPPHGIGDRTVRGVRVGSETLRLRLSALGRLRLHAFGHIHEDGGLEKRLGDAVIANVSHVDLHYRPARQAAVFDL